MVGKAWQPSALPTPTTTRSVKRTGAGAGIEAVEQAAHAGRIARLGGIKLLGMFGSLPHTVCRYLSQHILFLVSKHCGYLDDTQNCAQIKSVAASRHHNVCMSTSLT